MKPLAAMLPALVFTVLLTYTVWYYQLDVPFVT